MAKNTLSNQSHPKRIKNKRPYKAGPFKNRKRIFKVCMKILECANQIISILEFIGKFFR